MSDDPPTNKKEEPEMDAERSARAANLFDVRRFIGALFAIYGLILTVLGIGASDADIDQAAGINVNLWTGLAMLLVAGLFLAWAFSRPLAKQLAEEEKAAERAEADRTARGGPAPAGADAAAMSGSETTRRRPGGDRQRPGRSDRPGPQET
jgi:hypothetical protein